MTSRAHFHRWNKWWNMMKLDETGWNWEIMRALRLVTVSCTDVNPDGSPRWLRLASIVATLNQVVGAVYLERVLQADKTDNADNASASQHHDEKRTDQSSTSTQCANFPGKDRIFLFVFGGRDANYEDDELAYRNVLLAIFEESFRAPKLQTRLDGRNKGVS